MANENEKRNVSDSTGTLATMQNLANSREALLLLGFGNFGFHRGNKYGNTFRGCPPNDAGQPGIFAKQIHPSRPKSSRSSPNLSSSRLISPSRSAMPAHDASNILPKSLGKLT
jgi:hypothetical protein